MNARKLLAPQPMKRLSDETLGYVLPALGMKLPAVEYDQSLAPIKARNLVRDEKNVRVHTVSRRNGRHAKKPSVVSLRFLRRIGRLGGQARTAKLTQRQLSQIGRHAATARRSAVKAVLKKGGQAVAR
jgi:hypothetical protein